MWIVIIIYLIFQFLRLLSIMILRSVITHGVLLEVYCTILIVTVRQFELLATIITVCICIDILLVIIIV